MKEFLKQCLEDLEPLTGIRQLYFLQNEDDGARKVAVLIEGMLVTCRQFEYIPVEAQKKLIREQMVKDQDYTALNSRTLYKWFNGVSSLYWTKAQEPVQEVKELPPLTEGTKKMIAEYLNDLGKDMNYTKREGFANKLKAEMDKIQAEDKERVEGRKARDNSEYLKIRDRTLQAATDRGLDKVPLVELNKFNIEGKSITARNKEEAMEMFIEIYEN